MVKGVVCENFASPGMATNWSPEYEKLHGNQARIIRTLKANESAAESLYLKLKEKSWFDDIDDLSPKTLMRVVLTRVEDDTTQFYQFKSCLDEVPGLDLISKEFETVKGNLTCIAIMDWCCIV